MLSVAWHISHPSLRKVRAQSPTKGISLGSRPLAQHAASFISPPAPWHKIGGLVQGGFNMVSITLHYLNCIKSF